ncbi:MAG: type IX secretion system outer membrane channel protein PorV, partial [Aequorivita sp.]|nr:type IX secretion system outer membrane channel protein PorV [Aequorivita sp.]
MKKLLIPVLICLVGFKTMAQNDIENFNPITTGVPFMLIGADPRSGGMADIGVTTSADAFSQQWNPAKYAFSLSKQGVGVTYTPYLNKLVNDIFLGNLTYYNRLNERSAVAASLRYFSNGSIELRQTAEETPLEVKPNEFLFDVSYSLRLSDRFSMAVAGRYIRSDLKLQSAVADATAANTFAVDVAGYYQSEEIPYNDFDGRWRMGFNISNIGPKLKYDEVGSESNLPTNLALGGGFDFILDEYNKIGVSGQVNKLLVPTRQNPDLNGDGEVTSEEQAQTNQEYND